MMAAFSFAVLFTGCSDDDDKDNKGNGAGNGGSGVTVLPKRVAKIQCSDETGKVEDTYLFHYDSEGRVIKIIDQYASGINETEKTITYNGNKITITEDQEQESVITLKDGKAVSYTELDGNDWKYEYTFSYSDGYLSKVQIEEMNLRNGVWTKYSDGEDTYTVKDGNLVSVKSVWKDEKEQDITDVTCTYGTIANNANIDLGYICYDMDNEDPMMLCVLGKRYKNLPASLSSKDEDNWTYNVTFTYEVDKEGYVTVIKMVSTETDGTYTDVSQETYTITYE